MDIETYLPLYADWIRDVVVPSLPLPLQGWTEPTEQPLIWTLEGPNLYWLQDGLRLGQKIHRLALPDFGDQTRYAICRALYAGLQKEILPTDLVLDQAELFREYANEGAPGWPRGLTEGKFKYLREWWAQALAESNRLV